MSKLSSIGRVLGWTLGATVGLAGAGAALALRRPLPQVKGKVALPGLSARAQVLRDRWGVPHIYAASNADLFMAQGYVHAQDRLWQMELNRRTGHGQLAELFGPIALSSDRFIRVLGFSRVACAELLTLDEHVREAVEAYVRGVNAFLAQAGSRLPLEFALLRYRPRPWEPVDVLVWTKIMALNLSENWTGEVLRARLVAAVGPERASELEPHYPADGPLTVPPGAQYRADLGADAMRLAREAMPFTGGAGMAQGSNGWVVGGERSTSGKPLLSNDPHLGLGIPSLWYEMHLEGGDYAVTGGSFPGTPAIVIGHNPWIAWGVTNGMTDVQDLFIERFDPNDPLRYQYRDGWERAELIREEIRVKGQAAPAIEEVRVTRHGPVVSPLILPVNQSAVGSRQSAVSSSSLPTESEALSLRWTALEPGRILRSVTALNRARDWHQFRAALADWNVPPQNFVYADVDGHYGYALGGDIPVRAQGDGRLPVPGWDGAYEWTGYVPVDEMPASLDPPAGFVVTANNRIAGDEYPYHLSSDWLNPYRAARITQLIEATPHHDSVSFSRIQHDQRSLPGLEIAALAPRLPADTALAAAARDALASWDSELSAESVGGIIYAALRYHLVRRAYNVLDDQRLAAVGLGAFAILPANIYLDRACPDVLRRLNARDDAWLGDGRTWDGVLAEAWHVALDELRGQLGDDVRTWRYGRIHQLTLRHALGAIPALARIFNRGPWPTGGDLDTVCMGHAPRDTAAGPVYVAPSYRQICDPADWERSRSIHPVGQSGHPGSRHYVDFAKPWRIGGYHPMLWSRARVEEETVATLTLEPGD